MTVQSALVESRARLATAGVAEPALDSQLILSWVLKCRREDLAREPERALSAREQAIFLKATQLRADRRPVAYITGEHWFYGRPFKVNRAVLIPRPETEMLIAIVKEQQRHSASMRVADIGTGSGCIAVTAACELPAARVDAVDCDILALRVADKNRRRYQVEDRLQLHQGDLLNPLAGYLYNAVLSNPPYIELSEKDSLVPEVGNYEPSGALFPPANESVASLRGRLIEGSVEILAPGGVLAIEVGAGQASDAARDMAAAGLSDINVLTDGGGIERVVAGWNRRD